PILVIHGEEDTVVPPSDAHDIASAARQARLELVPGADHAFSRPAHLRPMIRGVATFLADALRSAIL
ncbi:MAG TPA: dienelactone hydrolase family protein, partial [Myxococcota bacterium]|nr:dienelactone hydrolase family protein [Myxococcota bacterium]